MTVQNLGSINAEAIKRFSTGLFHLDWVYGYNEENNQKTWGIPVGTISMWAGRSGSGKSRLAVEMAKSLCKQGKKVLYIQNEEPVPIFRAKVNDDNDLQVQKLFYVSDASTLQGQIDDIMKCEPDLVIIDSINEVEDFGGGYKTNVQRMINGESDNPGYNYRFVCNNIGCHIVLLNQMNSDDTIKGGTSLIHLVDMVFDIKYLEINSVFVIICERKNRYGKVGDLIYTAWQHLDIGVIPYKVQNKYFLSDTKNINIDNKTTYIDKYDQGKRPWGEVALEGFFDFFWFLKPKN